MIDVQTLMDDVVFTVKTRTENMKPEDVQKVTTSLSLLVGSASVFASMVKASRAAKRGEYDRAIYYAILTMSGQAALARQLKEAQRKGLVPA